MSPAKRPVTTHDLARHLDVSQSTVSRALRDEPTISAKQRRRIQEAAREMGYRVDPYVAAFTARVRNYRRSPKGITIAVLQDTKPARTAPMTQAAEAQAESYGYRVDPIYFAELEHDALQLSKLLKARGIQGLIVMPVGLGLDLSEIDFGGLACAQIGPSLQTPRLHMASANHFLNARLCYRTLHERGHRRIGLAVDAYNDARLDHQWLGGYTAMRELMGPTSKKLPVFYPEQLTTDNLLEWVSRHGFTAVIALGDYLLEKIHGAFPQVELARLTGGKRGKFSGINERIERVAATAVSLIVSQIHRNRLGIPPYPDSVLVPGEWVDGVNQQRR